MNRAARFGGLSKLHFKWHSSLVLALHKYFMVEYNFDTIFVWRKNVYFAYRKRRFCGSGTQLCF